MNPIGSGGAAVGALTYCEQVARTRRGGEVHTITGARRGVSDDVSSRTRRYLVSMAIRTVCFVLAVLVSGPLRWVFVVGALLLPYVAVVIANSGRERIEAMPVVDPFDRRPELEPPPAPAPAPPPGGDTASPDHP